MKTLVLVALVACVASANADVNPVAFVKESLARGCSRIVVPKGVYEIEPDGPNETVYFRLNGQRNVTIDFSGSKLIGKVSTRLFDIADCTNLVLRNFTVDYANLPFTFKRLCQFTWIGKRSDPRCKDIKQYIQHLCIILDFMSFKYVFYISPVEEIL